MFNICRLWSEINFSMRVPLWLVSGDPHAGWWEFESMPISMSYFFRLASMIAFSKVSGIVSRVISQYGLIIIIGFLCVSLRQILV